MSSTITITRRDDRSINLTFTDGTDPIDITGSRVFLTVKQDPNNEDEDAIIDAEATITNGPAGTATVALSKTETDKPGGIYRYRFQLVTASGAVQSTRMGSFVIEQDMRVGVT